MDFESKEKRSKMMKKESLMLSNKKTGKNHLKGMKKNTESKKGKKKKKRMKRESKVSLLIITLKISILTLRTWNQSLFFMI